LCTITAKLTLGGAAEVDGDGPREDGVPEGGAAEVVDAELHPGDAAVARGHVRAHARQRLRHQRRHAAVQHLEGLAAGGRDEEAAGDPGRGELLDLEADGVQRRIQLARLGAGALLHRRLLLPPPRGVVHGDARDLPVCRGVVGSCS
jgi:hypothetical protein